MRLKSFIPKYEVYALKKSAWFDFEQFQPIICFLSINHFKMSCLCKEKGEKYQTEKITQSQYHCAIASELLFKTGTLTASL